MGFLDWLRKGGGDPELEAKIREMAAERRKTLEGRARLVKAKDGFWFVLPFVDMKMLMPMDGESVRRKAARHLAIEKREPELKAEQAELQRQADEHNRQMGFRK